MILDMLPRFSCYNYRNSAARHSKQGCYFSVRHCALHGPYFKNVTRLHNRSPNLLTFRISSLIYHILVIFRLSPSPQVIWVYARAIITRMAGWNSNSENAFFYRKRHAVCATVFPSPPKVPVSIFIELCSPLPAPFCFFYFAPKSFAFFGSKIDFLNRAGKSVLRFIHGVLTWLSLAVSESRVSATAFFMPQMERGFKCRISA